MEYRYSRNLEANIIDWLTEKLADAGWKGINIVKVFSEAYNSLPAICVNVLDISPEKLEVGSKTNIKYYTVQIRIFGKSDGMRLDLQDFILDLLEDDIDYYIYTVENGQVTSKTLSGKINIRTITKVAKELVNTETLANEDKYRSIIEFICYIRECCILE